MKWFVLWLLVATACTRSVIGAAIETPLILISLDGFRWDYTELYPTEASTLRKLKREGASVRGLIPVFPSNTFPNHYSIVTGLYPAHHGIVNNDFFDPTVATFFHYYQPSASSDSRWWGGEPIWVTAIKQGRKAATSLWTGSEAEIGGVRPTFWQRYDYSIPFEKRLDELMHWMMLPATERPAFVAFYLEETNSAGHRFGPNSLQVAAAIKLCDERITSILDRLHAANIEANLLIVSDHGMTATNAERVVFLEDHVDRASVQVDADGSVLALRPLTTDVAALVQSFENVPHVKVYRAENLPARFRFAGNPRIAPVWILPDEGWHAEPRSSFERLRLRFTEHGYVQGDHGYDPALPSMHGILIGHGPAFRRGVEVPAAENIHVYNLMCAALTLKPAQNDGDDRLVKALLRE